MINIYITIMPIIFGGVANMIFTKTDFYKNHSHPIDNNIKLQDNQPIFGSNKTWIGFISMVFFTTIIQLLWGLHCDYTGINTLNDFYNVYSNTPTYNVTLGALLGLTYMIFELPNSFIKRRLKIKPGKTHPSTIGSIFFVVDQFDSVIGIGVLLYLLSDISLVKTILYILTGGLTHLLVNLILYRLKIRKNL